MRDQPTHVEVSTYLVIEPIWSTNKYAEDEKGRPHLEGARITSATVNKPKRKVAAGGIIAKIICRVEADTLLPFQPEAVIEINAGNSEVISVVVGSPDTEGDEE
jgi:hypothetical protein